MRSLIVTVGAPTSRHGGAALRNAQTIRALAAAGPVDVVALRGTPEPLECVDRVLWVTPEELDAARRRLRRRVVERAWRARPSAHWRLDAYRSPRALTALDHLVDAAPPDVVIASQWPTAHYARRAARGTRMIFDTHNVEAALRSEIGRAHHAGRGLDVRRLAAWEARLGREADEVWVCSDEDRARWEGRYGKVTPTRVVVNTVPAAGGPRWVAAACVPNRIVFVGTLSYRPNIDAVVELAREILPLVRRSVPDATFDIIGRAPSPEVCALHDPARGVSVIGPVDDVAPHLATAAAMVVPLRTGGGTRLKILEALAAGLPVVSTPKGAEGLDVRDGTHVLLGATPDELAAATTRVMTEPALAQTLSTAGAALVDAHYSDDALRRDLASALGAIGVR